MTAAQLKASRRSLEVAIIEPSASHWHQPAWTLVGAGSYDFEETRRNEASLIPYGADWIQNRITRVLPDNNQVQTRHSGSTTYDYLIIAPVLQVNSDALPGLKQALLTDPVQQLHRSSKKLGRFTEIQRVKCWMMALHIFEKRSGMYVSPPLGLAYDQLTVGAGRK